MKDSARDERAGCREITERDAPEGQGGIPILGWEQSGGESMPTVVEIVQGLLE